MTKENNHTNKSAKGNKETTRKKEETSHTLETNTQREKEENKNI